MSDVLESIRRKKPITDEHFVPADEESAEALHAAEARLGMAAFAGTEEERAEARAALEEARRAVRETGTSFVITAVGRLRFEELAREHPAGEEAKARNPEATFDPETFYPALFAESVAGGLTPEQWRAEFFDSPNWNVGEVAELRKKVLAVNSSTRVAELGN